MGRGNTMQGHTAHRDEPPLTHDAGTSPIRSDRRSFDNIEDDEPSYLIWFLLIFLAVTLGNLTSNYITAKVAEYQLMQAVGEAAKQSAAVIQQMQQRTAEQQAHYAQQQRQQRVSSPIGITLDRECSEWTQNHVQTKSTYAATEKNKRCGQLQHYIDTGTVPGTRQ
jgi:hypothetical protein